MSLEVAPCTAAAARRAVTQWHYSRKLPSGRLVKLGVWEDGRFVGCVIFGRGASINLTRRYNLTQYECVELVRVALREHNTPTTKIVAEALRQLRRHNPKLRLVVSFADPNHGHLGVMYRAGNWIYAGLSTPDPMWRDAKGNLWHDRQVTASGWTTEFGQRRRCPKKSECVRVTQSGKLRYLMPLDRAMRRQVEKLRQPYPAPQKAVS
jgi:hypothetical protein